MHLDNLLLPGGVAQGINPSVHHCERHVGRFFGLGPRA